MTLPLSTTDLGQLERALRVALAPDDHGSARAWCAALCEATSALVGDGALGSVVTMSPGVVHRSLYTEVPDDVDRVYVSHFAPLDLVQARMLSRRLTVAHEMDVCTRDELARSEFYHEFSLAYRVPCNFGVSAFRPDGVSHRLMLSFTHWPNEETRTRADAVLRVFAPAFAAGMETFDRRAATPGALAGVLDLLGEPTLVCDRRGTVVHQNPACGALLAEVRAQGGRAAEDALQAELRALAAGVGALLGARGPLRAGDAPTAAVRELRAGGQRLRARACFTAEGALGGEPLVWVAVDRMPADAADDRRLRARFGLTAQECAVARLLAERRTDAEIARTLGISPHTARTHAGRVRLKLGVSRRTEIAARLDEG
jgi:DNA-binding CsgD family transcriptional regulator/PAS domain-containing protein